MTYKTNKFFLAQNTSTSTQQLISTTYQEITGSRCNLSILNQDTSDFIYKFIFYTSSYYVSSSNYDETYIHIKLQKSNDNFSSNIVDLEGKQINFSHDIQQVPEFFYSTCPVFFTIKDLDSEYLRLVTRAYSTSNKTNLHQVEYFDEDAISGAFFNPQLIVAEV